MGRARREREHAAQLIRRYRQAQATAARYEAAAAGERQVAATLLTLTGAGWILLVDRRWPGSAVANVDMILVGPGGVFVIDVKNWRHLPEVVDGRLCAGADDRHDDIAKLLAITGKVQDSLAELHIAPAAVAPVMVFAGQSLDARIGSVRMLGTPEAAPHLAGSPRRLTASQVHRVAAHMEQAFPAYDAPTIKEVDGATDVDAPAEEELALFDAQAVARANEQAVYARPIESWMTFLHPDQLALVRRRWNGPARISGPAGTGKTVVGLHRAVWLAQRTTGRILYITFVRNLPRVHARLLARLSPAVADRVEFSSLHSWALAVLKQRGIVLRPHSNRVNTCFSLAWYHAGKGSVLQQLEPNPTYRQDEITYVIKGRGIADLGEYLHTSRPGRRTALQRVHKEAVWQLYQEYQRVCRQRGVQDFADVLLTALSAVKQHPVVPGYATVIADEVQDLTLTGVRLLHALVGDTRTGCCSSAMDSRRSTPADSDSPTQESTSAAAAPKCSK